jgi:hypothetical protein
MAGFFVLPTGGPEAGLSPEEVKSDYVYNRAGATLTAGKIAQFDFGAVVAELATGSTATYVPGTGNTVWNNVTATTAAGRNANWLGIVQDTMANDARGRVQTYGLGQAFVLASGGILPGTALKAQGTSGNSLISARTGQRLVGVYLAPQRRTGTRTPVRARVMFYGCCNYVVSNTTR